MLVTREISAGARPAELRDAAPARAERERRGQAQPETARRGDHQHSDLEQLEPQGGDLSARPGGAARGEPQFLEQGVGRGGERDRGGSRPSNWTTSALTTTRRARSQVPAA